MAKKSLFLPLLILGKIVIIFVIVYCTVGMYGFDGYIHLQYVENIIASKQILELNFVKSYYDFAGFHAFIAATSILTGLKPVVVYEFMSIVVPILIFDLTIIAFIRHTELKKNGHLPYEINLKYFSVVLLFPALIGIQMLLGRPNSLGIALFSLCLYLYICKTKRFRLQILAGFLAIVTANIHHLSAVFLVPVILFTSIFLAENYKTIFSFVYAIPAVLIVKKILDSREFNVVNIYFSQNPNYANLYNLFIKNEFLFLILWMGTTLVGYFIRTKYGNRIQKFFSAKGIKNIVIPSLIVGVVITEIIGIFVYSANLDSWFISIELTVLLILSGLAFIKPEKTKASLFILGLFFYGLTVVFSLSFGRISAELSWVAPRTFVFALIFIAALAFIAISDIIPMLEKQWQTLFIIILVVNSFFSLSYMGSQYLPGYNLTNNYENVYTAEWFSLHVNQTDSVYSIPFSISKFLDDVDIYRIPLILDANSSIEENWLRLYRIYYPDFDYIVIGTKVDQWLGTPLVLSRDNLDYLLNYQQPFNIRRPPRNLIYSNGQNFILHREV